MKTQEERLNYLIEVLKNENSQYKNFETPASIKDKKVMLRSLMNIRPPKETSAEILKIQDEYLTERAKEKCIVYLKDIKTIKENINSKNPYSQKISVWQGDITKLSCDAIVNAANSQMLGCFVPMHTCIDNCIHTFAGVQLRYECNKIMNEFRKKYGGDYEQPTAIPIITDGYNLPAKKVIHITGPIVTTKLTTELENDLANCYKNILDMCLKNNLKSVAFCCISTGVFNFPNEKAAEIAVETVTNWLKQNGNKIDRIIFNVFKQEDNTLYEKLLQ
ncbi:protein-ADP-ribose hydrolase [Candidatus Ruminimicrobium bovinum]|uniref:protein-ADP-ribose hydrolase n=1 Tax=Candidatus Ruminimicrobium bovinum TaxID=3242779 RepID=UPI0039B8C3BB